MSKKKEIPPLNLLMGLDNTDTASTSTPADATKTDQNQMESSRKVVAADPALEMRANKLFYIKRKYVKMIEDCQLKDGYKYTNDYVEHIFETFFALREKGSI